MFIRPIFLLFVALLLVIPVAYSAPLDDWDALVVEGSKKKFDGKYSEAAESFSKAVAFAEKQKLPDKCLPISLCRLAESQLNANQVKEADSHFDQITNLFKTQKASGKLDSQVSFWVAALADAYLSNHKPETRELCIKHACYLKTLVYGASHRNCTDCLNKLAEYYIDANKVDKALKILEMNEGLTAKQFGKNPDRFGNLLNDLAIKCEKEHKYNQAKQLEQEVIKIAQTNKSELYAGLPAFYYFLFVNAIEQDHVAESKQYFLKALDKGSKMKHAKNKQWTADYLVRMETFAWKNRLENKLVLAESEYKRLLDLNDIISTDSKMRYGLFSGLADVLYAKAVNEKKPDRLPEAIKCLESCLLIAEHSGSHIKDTISGLYLRLSICQGSLRNFDKAESLFKKALATEKEKNGFDEAMLYFWAGWNYVAFGEDNMAIPKLNMAYKISSKLPREKRGTIYADLLQLLSRAAHQHRDEKKAKQLVEQSEDEMKFQRKIDSKLGPDAYHRMHASKTN